MTAEAARRVSVFFDVHSDLPREAPGNRATVERALELAKPLPAEPNVLDIACGPGLQTVELAEMLPGARVLGVDANPPYVEALARLAAERSVADRVRARTGDMGALDLDEAPFDLVWCEGAAYILGFEASLRRWRPLLRDGAPLAASEAVFLRPEPSDAVRDFWSEYPAMTDLDGTRARIAAAGYALIGDFVLAEEAWWEHYYRPMQARLAELGPKYAGDVLAEAVLRECRAEIELYRRYNAEYGYAFFVMKPAGS